MQYLSLVLAICIIVQGACSPDSTMPGPPPIVTAIAVFPTSLALRPGESGTLNGSAFGTGGASIHGAVFAWASSNLGVATVNALGVVTAVNEGTATITASHGGFSRSRGVTVSNSAENFRIARVAVIQAIQDAQGAVPLIRNKPSAVRVLAESNIAGRGLSLRLRVIRGGSTVFETTATIGAVPVTAVVEDGSHGVMIALPPALDLDGTSVMVLLDPAEAVAESDEFDNVYPVDDAQALTTSSMPPLRIRFIPIAPPGETPRTVTDAEVRELRDFLLRTYPVSQVIADTGALYHTTIRWSTEADVLAALSELEAKRAGDGFDGHYYGVIAGRLPGGFIGYGLTPGRVSVGIAEPSTVGHEVGHNHGLAHTPGCGNPGTWPFPNAAIGWPGFDGLNGMQVPATAVDFMGYCGGVQWVSSPVYRALYNVRKPAGVLLPSVTIAAEPGDAIVITGMLPDQRTIRLGVPRFISNARGESVSGGEVKVQLLDDRRFVVRRTEAALSALSRESDATAILSAFTVVLRISPAERRRITSVAVSIPDLSLSAVRSIR